MCSFFTVFARQESIVIQSSNHTGISIIEGVLAIASSVMAIFLFILSTIALKKDKRACFRFVSAAFFLFAFKEAMFAVSEMILSVESAELEIVLVALDFAILGLFFLGLVKSE
jgi:hypothetical protein